MLFFLLIGVFLHIELSDQDLTLFFVLLLFYNSECGGVILLWALVVRVQNWFFNWRRLLLRVNRCFVVFGGHSINDIIKVWIRKWQRITCMYFTHSQNLNYDERKKESKLSIRNSWCLLFYQWWTISPKKFGNIDCQVTPREW